MGKYDDIIDYKWPRGSSAGRMTMIDRAKIFLPFAALKGYDEAIEQKQQIKVSRQELSEDMKDELDIRVALLEKEIEAGNNPIITVIYFVEESDNEQGVYLKKTGVAIKLSYTDMYLRVVDEKIPLKNIYSIEGELFKEYAI